MVFSTKHLTLCAFGFSLFLNMANGSVAPSKLRYQIEDLQFLEREKNYSEFILHAKDILPSKRDLIWRKMVGHMAVGFIDDILRKKLWQKSDAKQIEELIAWKSLGQDELYIRKRNQYAVGKLNHCYSQAKDKTQEGPCYNYAHRVWLNTPGFEGLDQLGVDLAIVLGPHLPAIELWPFVSLGTNSRWSEFHCKKGTIKQAIFAKANEIFDLKGTGELSQKEFINLLDNKCWGQISNELKQAFFNSSQKRREYIFLMLKWKKALTPEESDTYLTHYLLGGPIVGRVFDEAWGVMRELGQNFARREQVLEQMRKLDPLPDQIFTSRNQKRKKVITEFVGENFPEYYRLYGKTCLDYLSGKKEFPRGNPTVHCDEFFHSRALQSFMHPDMTRKYKKLKSFK